MRYLINLTFIGLVFGIPSEVQETSMLKWFRNISLVLLLLAAVIAGAAVWYTQTHEEEIKAFAVEAIEKRLVTDVDVEHIELSFFAHFPNAALSCSKVLIHDAFNSEDTLIYAEELSLEFNVFDLLQGTYEVNEVGIWNANAFLKRNNKGEVNYEFWKASESDDSTDFVFAINKAHLHDTKVWLNDQPADLELLIELDDLEAKGEFSASNFRMDLSIDAPMAWIDVDGISWLDHMPVQGEIDLEVDLDQQLYTVHKAELDIKGLDLEGDGSFQNTDEHVLCAFTAFGNNMDLQDLLTALPKEIQDPLSPYLVKGRSDLKVDISGAAGNKAKPQVDVSGKLRDGRITHVASGTELTKLESDFDYHFADTELLDITRISGELEGAQWQASGRLNELSSPGIELVFSGIVDAGNLIDFADMQDQINASGQLNFSGKIGGHLPRWKFDKTKTKLDANIAWKEGGFVWLSTDHNVNNIDAEFSIQGDKMEIEKLSAHLKTSDFNVHGSINHLITSSGNEGIPLVLDINLLSQHIDLADLYSSAETVATSGSFGFPKGIEFRGDIAVNSFTHQHFEATELKGKIDFRDGVLAGKQLALNTASGSATSDLTFTQKGDGFFLKSDSKLMGLRIEELFEEFDDFGQEFITSRHLKGACTSSTSLSASFSRDLDLDPNSIIAKVDLLIKDGELTSLESMADICVYLKEKKLISSIVDAAALERELAHIRFQELSNTIQIENGVISIPKMEVLSSALDINIVGSHSFANEIDYSLGFYLRDLLYDKSASEFGEIEDDGLGNNFYLSMKGTTESPEFDYDRLAHKEQRLKDFQKEKSTLKEIIKEDLNPFKRKGKQDDAAQKTTSSADEDEIKVVIQTEEEPEEKSRLRDLFKKKKKKSEDVDLDEEDF